jgi:hypothetical protein
MTLGDDAKYLKNLTYPFLEIMRLHNWIYIKNYLIFLQIYCIILNAIKLTNKLKKEL